MIIRTWLIMRLLWITVGSQGKANPLDVNVILGICATMNLKTTLVLNRKVIE